MSTWILWLVAAVILGGVELFTLTAVAGLLGGAALLTAVVAALGLPLIVQLPVFAAVSVAGLALLRPVAVRHMLRPGGRRFGVDALAGRTAHVVHEVTDQAGTVRLDGEEWTARTLQGIPSISAGTAVDVVKIDGATAVVYPRE
jgi:membrane protein implicated in regulation of membrane protease activity